MQIDLELILNTAQEIYKQGREAPMPASWHDAQEVRWQLIQRTVKRANSPEPAPNGEPATPEPGDGE